MGQNGSSLFKIDNGSIPFFYFFSIRSRYRYGIDMVSIRYRYDIVSIPTCQIIVIDIVIDSIMLKMYEKNVHFYVIETLSIHCWQCMEKKFTFTLSNRYQIVIDIVIDTLLIISISIKSELSFCPVHISLCRLSGFVLVRLMWVMSIVI
jgi:hypothetical protein